MSKQDAPNRRNDRAVLITTASGLISGVVSRVITHPIDSVKAKLQVQRHSTHGGIIDMIKFTWKEEKIGGFFRGLPISVIGGIPATGLYFGSYEFAKKNLLSNLQGYEFLFHFLSGIFAEIVACLMFVPIDVIKERRQVQINLKTYSYSSDFNAFSQILKTEGMRGIYKAYGATVMSFGPNSALYFMFFEQFKGFFIQNDKDTYLSKVNKGEVINLNFRQSVLCSLFASALSAFITTPLDLVKFRMQVQRASSDYNKESAAYRNMFQGIWKVYSTEGPKALYRGSVARVLSMAPTGTIAMTTVEMVKPIISAMIHRSDDQQNL